MSARTRGPAFPLPCGPDAVIRAALAAYYRALGDATAPIGDPDPAGWSDPGHFLDTLGDFFQLKLLADCGRLDGPELARYQRWSSSPLSRNQTLCVVMGPGEGCQCPACIPAAPAPATANGTQGTPGCRGGAPAVMGHGCPALAAAQPPSAVGPAPAISTDHATALPADPLLLGPQMQELPVAGPLNPADIICTKEARA